MESCISAYIYNWVIANIIPVKCRPSMVSRLNVIIAFSPAVKPSLSATDKFHSRKYPRKSFSSHYDHTEHYMTLNINCKLTESLLSLALVYGFRFSFLFWIYSLGLRTFRQSKNLSKVLTNRSVSEVSGSP